MAELHPQLQADCLLIGRFPLCRLLLMRDANYPWFILVPDREDVSEIYQLSADDQVQLTRESSRLAAILAERYQADKINIAALGNMVPQLHIHHVVRYRDDPAWPAPVWGQVPARPYTGDEILAVTAKLREGLKEGFEFCV
ncbi:MAG: HIT domain-containing protein [Pseudomonadota bacterium]|nr:HIT domain-containing protein [Pseudomonadota bacterium]